MLGYPRLLLFWAIDALRVDVRDYTFIDYGSGRGRVLLTAARRPFKRVIGVEFSRALHEEAVENLALYPREKLACSDIQAVHANAAEFALPDGNLVLFFYNPFTGLVLDKVADAVEAAARRSKRHIYIIFANSDRVRLFEGRPAFQKFYPTMGRRALLAAAQNVPIEFFYVSGGGSHASV